MFWSLIKDISNLLKDVYNKHLHNYHCVQLVFPPLKAFKIVKRFIIGGMNSPDVGDSNEYVRKDEKFHEWSPET